MGALVWKVSIGGQVYDADFETLKQWVAQGSVGPTDQVYKDGLGWSEAQRIPVLRDLFAPPSPPPSYSQPPGYDQSYGKTQYPPDPYAQSVNPYGQPNPYAPPSNPYAPPSYPYAPTSDPYAGGYGGTAPVYGSVGLGLSPYTNYSMPATAGLGKRFVGALMDGLIGFALSIPGSGLQRMGAGTPHNDDGSGALVMLGLLLQLGAFFGYMLFCAHQMSKNGTTPGKKIAGTFVLGDNGQFLTFGQAFLRQFLKGIFGIVCFVNLWLLVDSKHQQLYDKITGSNVYE